MAASPANRRNRRLIRATQRFHVRFLGLAVIVAATLAASAARAFPSSRLIYVRGKGTEQCPGEEIVRSEVSSRLGYDPFFVWAERTIVAQLVREGRQFHATVQLLDAQGVVRGSRSLSSSSDDCAELVKAVALAISIGIDPESATQSGPKVATADAGARSSPAGEPRDVSSAPPQPVTTPSPAPVAKDEAAVSAPRPPPRIEPEVGAGVWSAINLAPAVSVGGTVFAGVGWGPAALLLELKQNLRASGDGIGAALLAGAVLPCGRYDVLFACLNASWGELRLEGARSASARYVAVGARIGLQINVVHRLSLRFHIEGLRPLDQTIVMRADQEAWRLPALSGALGTDASLRF